MSKYNCTQLNPDETFEKHIYHRDQFAHYFRWSHILKVAKIGMNILDFGWGTGNLCEVFYRNKYRAAEYLGVEYRNSAVLNAKVKYANVEWANFKQCDLTDDNLIFVPENEDEWDIITCFEVLEHVGKENVEKVLKNIYIIIWAIKLHVIYRHRVTTLL